MTKTHRYHFIFKTFENLTSSFYHFIFKTFENKRPVWITFSRHELGERKHFRLQAGFAPSREHFDRIVWTSNFYAISKTNKNRQEKYSWIFLKSFGIIIIIKRHTIIFFLFSLSNDFTSIKGPWKLFFLRTYILFRPLPSPLYASIRFWQDTPLPP